MVKQSTTHNVPLSRLNVLLGNELFFTLHQCFCLLTDRHSFSGFHGAYYVAKPMGWLLDIFINYIMNNGSH